MLEDFVNGKIYLKVTKYDLDYLHRLAKETGLKFCSHDSLYGDYMCELLNTYSFLYISATKNGVVYCGYFDEEQDEVKHKDYYSICDFFFVQFFV